MSRAARRFRILLPILGCFGGGSLYGWSGYLPAVRGAFDVGNAAASMVFSVALVCVTLGVLLGPMLLVRVSPRFALPILAGLAAISLCAAAGSTGFARFLMAYGVVFGFAAGVIYNHTVSMASALGGATLFVPISVAAFGLGGAVFGPVQVWLTALGWGLWSVAPALICLAGVACLSLFLRPPPENPIAKPPVIVPVGKPGKAIAVLWTLFAAGSCSGLIVLGFAAQFLSQTAGSVGLASVAIFLAALGNTLGRISSAVTVGLFGPARGIAGAQILSIITLACLVVTPVPGIVIGLLFILAFTYGQLAATMPLLVRSQVSAPAFSGTFGWVFTGWGFAGLVGPWTAGALLDATGTLQAPLMACMVLGGLCLWLVLPFTKRGGYEETR